MSEFCGEWINQGGTWKEMGKRWGGALGGEQQQGEGELADSPPPLRGRARQVIGKTDDNCEGHKHCQINSTLISCAFPHDSGHTHHHHPLSLLLPLNNPSPPYSSPHHLQTKMAEDPYFALKEYSFPFTKLSSLHLSNISPFPPPQ